MHHGLRAGYVLIAALFACSTSSATGTSGDGGIGADALSTAAAALGCPAIFDCAGKCMGTSTDACEDACFAQGSPSAKEATTNIVSCVERNMCMAAACFETNCVAELGACINSATSGGQPLTGGAPAGSVPADLAGRWFNRDGVYEFKASGTATYFTTAKVGSCSSEKLESGTAVAAGTDLTLYFTSAAKKFCDMPSTAPYTPRTEGFTYVVEQTNVGPKLRLTEKACRYSDPQAAYNYCSYGFDRE